MDRLEHTGDSASEHAGTGIDTGVAHGPKTIAEAMTGELIDESSDINADLIDGFIRSAEKNPKRLAMIEKFAPGFNNIPQHAKRVVAMKFLEKIAEEGRKQDQKKEAAKQAAALKKKEIDLVAEETGEGVSYVYKTV